MIHYVLYLPILEAFWFPKPSLKKMRKFFLYLLFVIPFGLFPKWFPLNPTCKSSCYPHLVVMDFLYLKCFLNFVLVISGLVFFLQLQCLYEMMLLGIPKCTQTFSNKMIASYDILMLFLKHMRMHILLNICTKTNRSFDKPSYFYELAIIFPMPKCLATLEVWASLR